MRRHLNKKRAALAGVVVAIAVSAVAIAFWTSTGSGTGSAQTGTSVAITVNQTSSITGLYPGGPAQTLSGTFTNTGSPVQVASISASVSGTSDNTNCPASNFSIGGSPLAGPFSVPSGTGVGTWTGLTISMVASASNQDECKNETVNISYTANAS